MRSFNLKGFRAFYEKYSEEDLKKIGFNIGKYIYILDAYEDLEKDEKSNAYNPLLFLNRRNRNNCFLAICCSEAGHLYAI